MGPCLHVVAIHANLSFLPLPAARMATPASAPDTRALVADFVGYKLRQKGYVCGAGPGEGPAANPLHQAMRAAGDEFETRFRQNFSDLAAQLHVTPGSAQQSFTQVCDELFQRGPNWGRVVAFFAFGAALCAESVNKEMEPLVGQVQEWMVAYLETQLADWIHSSGGWVRNFSNAGCVHSSSAKLLVGGCREGGMGVESPHGGGSRPRDALAVGIMPGSPFWDCCAEITGQWRGECGNEGSVSQAENGTHSTQGVPVGRWCLETFPLVSVGGGGRVRDRWSGKLWTEMPHVGRICHPGKIRVGWRQRG